MDIHIASASVGEGPRAFRRSGIAAPSLLSVTEPAILRRHTHLVRFSDVEADFTALIDAAIAAIVDGEPCDDDILGDYIHLASLVRAVSFREGKLLEQALERVSRANPDLLVLTQSIKLPLVKSALEAIAGNDWSQLDGITLDCESPAKGSYTPDMIVVHRTRHVATILDLKRSLASYGDTSRLEELKAKMMAAALVLPDWLYKQHKRVMVDTVGVAIVDGASRPSDHESGIWALSEIDDLIGIDGAAACMAELRLRFGYRVQQVLEGAARKVLRPLVSSHASEIATMPVAPFVSARINLNAHGDWPEPVLADLPTGERDEAEQSEPRDCLPARVRVGFARRSLGS